MFYEGIRENNYKFRGWLGGNPPPLPKPRPGKILDFIFFYDLEMQISFATVALNKYTCSSYFESSFIYK